MPAKLDGHRGIVVGRGPVLVRSRRGNDLTGRYPGLGGLGDSGLGLDGELLVHGSDGLPTFHRVMGGSAQPSGHRFAYAAFDVLHADGADLRSAPVEERLGVLAAAASRSPSEVATATATPRSTPTAEPALGY